MKRSQRLYNEFVAGQKPFDWMFLAIGLLLQVVAYVVTREGWLSLFCGLVGVCSIILCSQRKISSFVFGVLQIVTYMVLALRQHFYGELAENAFYLVTCIYGFFLWIRHYDTNDEGNQVETLRLTGKGWMTTLLILLGGILGGSIVLKQTNDSQPLLDAVSTVPAFIAQILMMLRYREQWIFWLIVDATTTAMWIRANDWCMTALFGFWTLNCIYGYWKWR